MKHAELPDVEHKRFCPTAEKWVCHCGNCIDNKHDEFCNECHESYNTKVTNDE